MDIRSKVAHLFMHIKYKMSYINNIDDRTAKLLDKYIKKNTDVDIDLVTIAFNNPQVIEMQIVLINQNLIDRFSLIIADNSNSNQKANEIYEICKKYQVDYIRLPSNPYNGKYGMGSNSNGSAMNFMYRYYISKRRTKYFGFLDHDIFPIKKNSIIENLSCQKFWGVLRCMPSKKNKLCNIYLWAGFCFFSKFTISVDAVDFLPKRKSGDTGSSNYDCIYYPIIRTDAFLEYTFPKVKRVNINDLVGSPQGSQYEIISDTWLHYLNASNWTNEDITVKESKMIEIIHGYEGENENG